MKSTQLLLVPVLLTGGLLSTYLFATAGSSVNDPAALGGGAAVATADDESLERALDAITEQNLRSDLYFIASDAMKGRDTPSPELKIAARYIRARLMRLGFEPGAQDESYFYNWTYPQSGLNADQMSLKISGLGGLDLDLTWARDYFIGKSGFGMREVSGDVLWGGSLDAKKLGAMDVEGKWVIGVNSKGLSSKRRRVLRENGALGLVVIASKKAKESVAETFSKQAAMADRVRLSKGAKSTEGFPVIHLSESVGASILAALPKKVKVGKKIDLTIEESCGQGRLEDAKLENVVGIWPGSDRKLKNEVIILSAHYDHVGHRKDGTIFNGADDNGSGTCGLMAIAEALHAYGPMRRTIMLTWVSGEEKGLLGSEAWTKDPYLPGKLVPLCNINIDMIGRNKSTEFHITPTKDHPAYSALTQVAEANMRKEGFKKIRSADAYWGRSDHANFSKHLGIPVAFLFCDVHEDYHQPTDTVEKIDYDKMRRICRLVVRMLVDLQIDQPKF